jgi:hypothetical protein
MASTASDVCGHSILKPPQHTWTDTERVPPSSSVNNPLSDLRMPPRAMGAGRSIFDRAAIKG